MSSPNLLTFTDQNFASEVLQSPIPVLVDYSAVWCELNKALLPIVERIADDFAGRVRVGVLDIDDSPGTPKQYGVRSVPTCMVFRDGQKVGAIAGLTDREQLLELLGLE
ncbi:thioredoxin [Nannocystis exedens]|uniref:Thioredoxin n=1 Tax=Nannocystis exedens TaxID=54 RepID=A0A1I2GU69_9BACT|nr:thioredoxin domain-containing protein [Nannocystis exedens]PCC74103.1 thiol reductase thioredoxin [Nannocystis exedens]SFF20680.1 thioredoxin [Nannocystis exedens]